MKALYLIFAVLLPPCEWEDDTGCHWNAKTMGDGNGTSFVAFQADAGDVLVYETGNIIVFLGE